MVSVLLRTFWFLILLVILSGCENKSELQLASGSIAKFSVPDDGKLTERQVENYIVIRQQINREVSARNQAEMIALIEGTDNSEDRAEYRYFDEIEKAVANTAGMSYREFLWIKDTVITTQTTMWLQQYYDVNNKIVSLLDKTLTDYKRSDDVKQDKQEQQLMLGYVDEMKQELQKLSGKIPGQDFSSEAFVHNSAILNTYKQALDALDKKPD